MFKAYLLILIFALHVIQVSAQDRKDNAQRLNEVVVSSSPLETTSFDSAQPVTVLEGQKLREQSDLNIGAALASQPGISQSYFGPGASRPVVRGLAGDRVRVLENGVGSQDVSNSSPDHAVVVDPSLVSKIEVLRGPAALMYGTQAIGGAVNIFDNRIPDKLPTAPIAGSLELRGGTVDQERAGSALVSAAAGPVVLQLNTSRRRTDDIRIPGFARREPLRGQEAGSRGRLRWSDTDLETLSLGGSYVGEQGFVGAAVSDYNTNYGVPNGEEDISIDARRKRLDLRGKVFEPFAGVESVELRSGLVDYEHTEFEGSEIGTRFKNRGFDSRIDLTHTEIAGVKGVVGLQFQSSEFAAIGEEAFQPPTDLNVSSGFIFEQFAVSEELRIEIGGRVDLQDTETSELSRDFTTFSQSAGAVWNFAPDYAAALSLAHTERAPSGQELFADGPHIATAAFEVGDPNLGTERSLGVDLNLRKERGSVTGFIGGFYNRFYDYTNLSPTAEFRDDLRVFRFEQISADFIGFESQVAYHLIGDGTGGHDLSLDFQPDYVRATDLDRDRALPRITPLRMKFGLNYKHPALFDARLEVQRVFAQSRTADFETSTPGYNFLNLYLSRPVTIGGYGCELFVRGANLLNEKAREHLSFIKDVAPLPGLNVAGGVRVRF